ncbi:phage shock protein C (PspC) family protein [Motilibacter rhizosphaerae]|uniref:Phage shock protein C (PspC) family protein n=1 Tax=Motilibacter rhizosphaerae TaxID=598652 RepID=A0A4Q7NTH3_9ACTN|nr:ATP-binding protein [Motilibacter rhizosphaerae]RZS90314.1 phage shock protein C (PspC) family protein [Motilibacter rhizosphaerae]
MDAAHTPWQPAPRLVRLPDGVGGGVARGLAAHLGIDVRIVRAAFVVLAFCSGAGVLAYVLFWWLAPVDSCAERRPRPRTRVVTAAVLVAVALAVAAGDALLRWLGLTLVGPALWPVAVVVVGVAIVWWQADESQRARWFAVSPADLRMARLRSAAGVLLVVVGGVALLGSHAGLTVTVRTLVSALVLVAGLALVTLPYWVRMARDLQSERAARVREQERAEVAAHLHDSVLQTLTLIQRRVDDPREVARLARAQERELRAWLYRPETETAASFAAALARTLAEVEDAHGTAIEVVTVGDAPLDGLVPEPVTAVLGAVREAAVNAAKHGAGAAVSVYAEVGAEAVEVWVRDRGPGFVLADVPDDRLGVRRSILGRMERHGGRATVRSAPGEGTEVSLVMPLRRKQEEAAS